MIGIFKEGTSIFEIGSVTTITGLILVFSMLLFLVLVLTIFGWVGVAVKKSADKKAQKAKADLARQLADEPTENAESLPVETSVSQENDSISPEIVAVISAAISEMYAGTGKKPVIKAVKKSGGRRSAWASAGIANNTRSF